MSLLTPTITLLLGLAALCPPTPLPLPSRLLDIHVSSFEVTFSTLSPLCWLTYLLERLGPKMEGKEYLHLLVAKEE